MDYKSYHAQAMKMAGGEKQTSVNSKQRAVTRRASFQDKVHAMEHNIIREIDMKRQPSPKPVQHYVQGPKQPIRVWRRK